MSTFFGIPIGVGVKMGCMTIADAGPVAEGIVGLILAGER